MKISVIIPTYNRASFLEKSIKSVLNQTAKIDEIIVVDDGSNDNTSQIIKQFDVKYIYQNHQGVSKARNTGIINAKNEWIAFLDSDDIWHNNKIEQHIIFHTKNPNHLASYTNEQWIRNGKIIQQKGYQEKEQPSFLNSLKLCKIGASTFFCHKKIFEAIGYFDETLIACEDYDLWLRILQKYPIQYIEEKLTSKYAGHQNQLSFETKTIDKYRIYALKKHLESEYKREVLEELIYKTELLIKGAKKHGNTEILEEFEKELNYFISLK